MYLLQAVPTDNRNVNASAPCECSETPQFTMMLKLNEMPFQEGKPRVAVTKIQMAIFSAAGESLFSRNRQSPRQKTAWSFHTALFPVVWTVFDTQEGPRLFSEAFYLWGWHFLTHCSGGPIQIRHSPKANPCMICRIMSLMDSRFPADSPNTSGANPKPFQTISLHKSHQTATVQCWWVMAGEFKNNSGFLNE